MINSEYRDFNSITSMRVLEVLINVYLYIQKALEKTCTISVSVTQVIGKVLSRHTK